MFHFLTAAGPDVIAIGATLSHDGIAVLDRGPSLAAMSIAALNIGGASAVASSPAKPQANEVPITVSGEVTGFIITAQYQIFVCETDAVGACLAPLAPSVTTSIGDGAKTFSAFLLGDADLGMPFFPSVYRMKILFKDANGKVVGSTSVALDSDAPAGAGAEPTGVWEGIFRFDADTAGTDLRPALLFIPPANLPIRGVLVRKDPVDGSFVPQILQMDGVFDSSTNTRTGNVILFATGNIPGAVLPATLSYTPDKQISLSMVDPAAATDVPQRAPAGPSASGTGNLLSGALGGSKNNPLSGLLGGSGSGGGNSNFNNGENPLRGVLGGSGGGAGTPPRNVDATLTVDAANGTATLAVNGATTSTLETTPVGPVNAQNPFGGLFTGAFMTLGGLPGMTAGVDLKYDGYLMLQKLNNARLAGKTLTPIQQFYVAMLQGPFAVFVPFLAGNPTPDQLKAAHNAIFQELGL